MTPTLTFHPVTPDRWPDLDRLFGESAGESLGNPSRCWCMELRRPGPEWEREAGEGNRRAMREVVGRGDEPGIIAYVDGEAAGWCAVTPRTRLSRLIAEGSFRNPTREDVWSITCFYVAEKHQGKGVMKALLRAAVEHAVSGGAKVVEAYPMEREFFGDGAGGSVPQFEAAGFVEVHRISPQQVTMRYSVGER
jgi:GNAT superfamily N-acetyltransferase